jgi:hypothetical protein
VANKQSTSVTAQVSQTQNQTQAVQGEVGAKSSAKVDVSVEDNLSIDSKPAGGEAKANIQELQSSQPPSSSEVISTSKIGIEADVARQANQPVVLTDEGFEPADISKQDLESLGEYLEKNNLIPDLKGAKARILNVLAKGDLEALPDDDRQNLLEILQKINTDSKVPKSVKNSASNIVSKLRSKQRIKQSKPVGLKVGTQTPSQQTSAVARNKIEPESAIEVVPQPDKHKDEYEAKLRGMRKREAQLSGKGSAGVVSGRSLSQISSQGSVVSSSTEVGVKVGASQKTQVKVSRQKSTGLVIGNNTEQLRQKKSESSEAEQLSNNSSLLPTLGQEVKESDRESGQSQSAPSLVPPALGRESDKKEIDEKSDQEKLASLEETELERQRQSEETLQQAREILASQQGVKNFNVREAEALVNKEIDLVLNRLAFLVWVGAIPSFGLSIVIGAILGDIIWLMGPRVVVSSGKIVSWLMNQMPVKSPLNKASDLVAKIQPKLSAKVKLQILLMNLIVLIILFLIIVIIIAVLYDICSSKLNYLSADAYNLNEYCASIKNLVEGASQ